VQHAGVDKGPKAPPSGKEGGGIADCHYVEDSLLAGQLLDGLLQHNLKYM
jgi:hypothetical protein